MKKKLNCCFVLDSAQMGKGFRNSADFRSETKGKLFTAKGILGRESTTNVIDQQLADKIPEMCMTAIELAGIDKHEFLEAIDWSTLAKHLKASSTGAQAFEQKLSKAVERVENPKNALRLLKVADFETTGLTGAETDDDNFYKLCVSEFNTDKAAGKGGSHGHGKEIYWRCSGIGLVLFSSVCANPANNKNELRLFGHCKTKYHKIIDVHYTDDGLLGELNPGAPRAESVWNENALAKTLKLDRPCGRTGTSILIVDFEDPEDDTVSDLSEICQQLNKEIQKWWWPAIAKKELIVKVGLEGSEKEVILEDIYAKFAQLHNKSTNGQALDEVGDVIARDENVEFPCKKVEECTSKTGTIHFKAERVDLSKFTNTDLINCLALTRDGQMVMNYERISNAQEPSIGLVLAGEARPNPKEEDKDLSEFLRQCEPPAHNSWSHKDKIKELYKMPNVGAATNIVNLCRKVGIELFLGDKDISGRPLNRLSQLFRFGNAGKITHVEQTEINVTSWSLLSAQTALGYQIEIKVNSKRGLQTWKKKITFKVAGAPGSLIVENPRTSTNGLSVKDFGPMKFNTGGNTDTAYVETEMTGDDQFDLFLTLKLNSDEFTAADVGLLKLDIN